MWFYYKDLKGEQISPKLQTCKQIHSVLTGYGLFRDFFKTKNNKGTFWDQGNRSVSAGVRFHQGLVWQVWLNYIWLKIIYRLLVYFCNFKYWHVNMRSKTNLLRCLLCNDAYCEDALCYNNKSRYWQRHMYWSITRLHVEKG